MNQLPNDAASDQSNCPEGYYRNSKGMVMRMPEQQNAEQSPLDLAAIEGMDAPALRNLIRTCYGTIAGYALLNDEEKAEAARLKLYSLGMTSNEVHKVVPALDKWFDRTQGKAAQSISLDVKDQRMDKMPIDRLLRLAAMLDEPVLIAPMPKD